MASKQINRTNVTVNRGIQAERVDHMEVNTGDSYQINIQLPENEAAAVAAVRELMSSLGTDSQQSVRVDADGVQALVEAHKRDLDGSE